MIGNSLPQREKVVEINGNSYKVAFPNNRQFIAIYARKSQLTKEQYDSLNYSIDGNARYAALLADAVAVFETIMPDQFHKDINIKSIVEGDVLMGAELVSVYQSQITGWFAEWEKAITEILKPKDPVKP